MAGPPSTSSAGRRQSAGPKATPGAFGAGSPLEGQSFEAIADKLKDPSVDYKAKTNLATELRDAIDMYQKDLDLGKLFDILLPAFTDILRTGKPAFVSTSGEHKLRNLLIQILHRLPHVEPLRQHAPSLMSLLLKLLRIESEDNAVLCMKVIIDLHRTYSRPPPPSSAQPANAEPTPDPTVAQIEASVDEFLEIVADLFKNMGSVVEETFREAARQTRSQAGQAAADAQSPSSGGPPSLEGEGGAGNQPVVYAPAMRSFKLLQDCPASIVFIFQTYRPLVNKAITIFVPLVFEFIQMQAEPQRRKHESMEHGKSWVGICPEIPKDKRGAFQDMVMAQTKTMSFLAYIHRVSNTALSSYLNVLPEIAVRLMKDCPSEAVAMKRDLIIATRHILQSDLRTAFLSQIDTLLDEHVLTGNSVTGHENLRPLAFSMLADLIHHCRADLTLPQLSRVVHTYCANVHDATLASAIQTMCSKLLLNLIDPIASKEPQEAVKILQRILLAFVSRMEAMAEVRDEWAKWSKVRESLPITMDKVRESEKERREWEKRQKEKGKGRADDADADGDRAMESEAGADSGAADREKDEKKDEGEKMDVDGVDEAPEAKVEEKKKKDEDAEPNLLKLDDVDIERAKPIRKAVIMVDPGPDPVKDARFLFRNLLFGFKTLGLALNRMGGQGPDAELMCRFFDAAVKCMVLFDPARDQGREQKEVMEVLTSTLVQTELVIFQEVVENRMGFFFDELIRNHELLVIPQSLLSNENVSQHFVAILFRFLSSRLPELGNSNKENTSVMLRLYKMSFMAVTIFPEKNEPVLLPHLSNLIMNSLKLASQASEPNSYYLLLRALFRSIGGGRFEILYNEVLPLLQTLLEQLNALLKSADKSRKDLFAELILTVPVRLSVLLPYLSYLMRPLVHALQAGSELVSQGLRTLELCVDNLTQEFLNPLFAPVIDEVVAGLWKLLRPLPFNHQHAHTTMRILGKIGGRNRKGFEPPKLEWKNVGPEALLNVKFEGTDASIRIGPIVDVALKIIRRGDVHYRRVAYQFLKYSVAIFLREGLLPGEPEETFGNILKGLFDATRVDDFHEEANKYMIDLARVVFAFELGKEMPENPNLARQTLPLSSAFVDGVIENLCTVETSDMTKAATQTKAIVEHLLAKREPGSSSSNKPDAPTALLHQMGSRLASHCYDPSWQRKCGAARGMLILISEVGVETKWIIEHEIEFTRALLFALKDMPGESPSNADMVVDTLLTLVRVCSTPVTPEDKEAARATLNYLVGLLLVEVSSQVAPVRDAVKRALKIVSENEGKPLTEMLTPVKDRLLGPIFTKPLRALGFTMQIGHIDAVTYCITLNPPLIEVDDQLVRLLHEALGIADAEDVALLGGKVTHKTMAPLTQLRVVCVQLLSAALANPQLNTPAYNQTRIRALSVYFKLLYSKAPEVVDAAYHSLKQVMLAQGKLPKDLLQTGLKPVLMNLADHKKLSVASLHGLARLLELLTNYFKVEIGQKLVDHFRSLAIPADILRATAKQPSEDGELEVMAAIVNIFHLLPHPAAGMYLEDVVEMVVSVERLLKKLKTSIFTVPLAKFLALHPEKTTIFFFGRLSEERYVPTFRAVIAAEQSQPIRDYISDHVQDLFSPCFDKDGDFGYHVAMVVRELIEVDKMWIGRCEAVLPILITRWVSDIRRGRLKRQGIPHVQQLKEDQVVVEIFVAYLEQAEHIDLLFHLVEAYTYLTSADHTALSRFLTRHVALNENVAFRRQVLDRFLDIFDNENVAMPHKSAALRLLVNPILLVSYSRGEREEGLISAGWIAKVHAKVWHPLLVAPPELGTLDEEELRVELCHMTTLLIRSSPSLLDSVKKDVIKFGWMSIRFDDISVTQTAYILISTFLAEYESPAKIVGQIYVALLRAHQPEARNLVREALDILAPALPKRMPGGTTPAPGQIPGWEYFTRKTLIEEGSTMPLLVNIYQLIVRHPDLFFASRDQFFPHLVASLGKLTLSTTITPDTRALTLDVIEVILKWEKKRLESTKQDEGKAENDDDAETAERSPKRAKTERGASMAPSAASSGAGTTYIPPPSLRDQVVNNLLRFISNSQEPVQRNNLVYRALALLRELIGPSVWDESNVKFSFFQRTFSTDVTEETLGQMCNSAEILNVVSSYKPAEWHVQNIAVLHSIVEKGFTSGEMRLTSSLRPVVERLFDHLPRNVTPDSADVPATAKAFIEWARSTVEEGLRAMTNLPAVILILQSWSKVEPERIDAFIPALVRVFTRYLKEHTASPTAVSSVDPNLRLLVSSLDVLRQRVSHLGEQRRWFLSGIVQLVEKSSNIDVCRFLLQMVRKWVFDKDEPYPTLKEKAGILSKMTSFENRNSEALQKDFLNLILDVYTDASLARSELTFRLEPAFLMGCKVRDPVIRSKFLATFDKSLATGLFSRLHYIIGVQSWETLSETYWIHQALDLLLGAVDTKDPLFIPGSYLASAKAPPADFIKQLETYTTGEVLAAARKLLYADPNATHATWISTFKTGWSCLSRSEQRHLTEFMVGLLVKDYHLRSVDRRPNVVQTLLQSSFACTPPLVLPPHVVRYHARTFNAWYTGIELLQDTLENPRESDTVKETAMDALTELYAELSEDDLFYGLWRRRAAYNETNAALSWEQIGQWAQAQVLHESAQITARSGVMPFTESELALWEDHWIITAQKLQQWDVLSDMAKNEGNKELLLECAWRLADWNQERPMIENALETMSPVGTPRRRVFETYLALLAAYSAKTPEEATNAKKMFAKLCDEGVQLSLRKWYYLPETVTQAHYPLLQTFQQFVELQEAQQIFASLAGTNAANLDTRSNELKSIVGTWRDRLPNLWDDINVWSDLVAWRQHVFSAINKAYLPLVPAPNAPGGQQNASSFAHRGFHETAWIINRFAHVARKHHLSDVCITSLTKIYTLPNIEIQEAFLKLREQAKAHYQNPSELANGLEVINNTNLMYFNGSQKAEFFTLKGMFLAKLHLHDEANQTFNLAVSMDMSFPKAWAEWGEYHDRMFKENPADLNIAANAVSCYLQAAGLYKSAKVRKLLVRILWLLSLDDAAGTVSKAFDNYKGEIPTWYWITFIPQLLVTLSKSEARYVRVILLKIAKTYPQALFFQLRTTRDELSLTKRQWQQAEAIRLQAAKRTAESAAANGEPAPAEGEGGAEGGGQTLVTPGGTQLSTAPANQRQPWDYIDEIMAVLKTAFPLLALSMEMIVDQISTRFKPAADEDIYRLISALLADALQQYVNRAPLPTDDGLLTQATNGNIARFAESLHSSPVKEQFVKDFLTSKPTLREYLQRLQGWRDRYEAVLNKKAKRANLEASSHWLVEFQYQKFDEIEVPGQYLQHEDSNNNFVRISHFANKYDVQRGSGIYFRRLTILGQDGSIHQFMVQLPAPRTSRREERIMQLFRMLNCTLANRKESRKRNLQFMVPTVVPLSPGVRIVENDASVTTLQEILEDHVESMGLRKEDPVLAFTERIRTLHRHEPPLSRTDLWSARQEAFEELSVKMTPDDVLKKYMIKSMASPNDLWHLRKHMTTSLAAFIFMTYTMSMADRRPARVHISRATGKLYTSDMVPSIVPGKPELVHNEPVPFRFTPNMQRFIGPHGVEGLLTSSLIAIASALTESEYDLEHRLSIFVREEINTWFTMSKSDQRTHLREYTLSAIDAIVRKAKVVSAQYERARQPSSVVPVCQSVVELLIMASNPANLSKTDPLFVPNM
ncbi:transcription-associated protein 1 [Rhodotorula toruloides]